MPLCRARWPRRLVRYALAGRLDGRRLGLHRLLGGHLLRLLLRRRLRLVAALAPCCGRSSTGCGGGNGRRSRISSTSRSGTSRASAASGNGMSMNGNMAPNSSAAANARDERLAQPAIGLATTDPRHRDDALAFGAASRARRPTRDGAPLPLRASRRGRLRESRVRSGRPSAPRRQLAGGSRSQRAARENSRGVAAPCEMRQPRGSARRRHQEHVQRAELAELLERPTRLLEQRVLLALQRKRDRARP